MPVVVKMKREPFKRGGAFKISRAAGARWKSSATGWTGRGAAAPSWWVVMMRTGSIRARCGLAARVVLAPSASSAGAVLVIDDYIGAGDHCLQAVPGATGVWAELPISDVVWLGTQSVSSMSRVMVIALTAADGAGSMTASISGVAALGVHGRGAGTSISISIENSDSTGVGEDIKPIGYRIDDDRNTDRPMGIQLLSRMGGLRNIHLIAGDVVNRKRRVGTLCPAG